MTVGGHWPAASKVTCQARVMAGALAVACQRLEIAAGKDYGQPLEASGLSKVSVERALRIRKVTPRYSAAK